MKPQLQAHPNPWEHPECQGKVTQIGPPRDWSVKNKGELSPTMAVTSENITELRGSFEVDGLFISASVQQAESRIAFSPFY